MFRLFSIIFMAMVLKIFTAECLEDKSEDLRLEFLELKPATDGYAAKVYEVHLSENIQKRCFKTEICNLDGPMSSYYYTDDTCAWLTFGHAHYGEPFFINVKNSKRETIAKTKCIPFPLEVHDDQGHQLEIETGSSSGEHFILHLNGFEEGEELFFESYSEGEIIRYFIKAEKGRIHTLLPAVIGKYEGSAYVQVSNRNVKLRLNYGWGKPKLRMAKMKDFIPEGSKNKI